MGFLDNIFGSSSPTTIQTQTVKTDPWEPSQQHLKNIFSGAQAAYDSPAPQYYPESRVVGFSPQTQGALQGIEARAVAGSPLQRAGMDQALSTVQGDYLNANPFLANAYAAASAPVIEQWQNQVAPGISSTFSAGGRMGSGLYAQTRNTAENTLARNLTNMSSKMAYANYQNERKNQLNMAANAQAMASGDYNDYSRLMAVGGAREGLEQAELQDRIGRFTFEQNRPWDQLARSSGMIGGGYGSSQERQTPLYSNPGANFLSGALGGAQLGKLAGFGGDVGAIGGGLLGLLGG